MRDAPHLLGDAGSRVVPALVGILMTCAILFGGVSPAGAAGAQIGVTEMVSPSSLAAPGGTFTFTVAVSNPGTVGVKITSLVDNVYGDLATRAGSTCGSLIATTLAPGATSSPCTFTGTFNGAVGASQTDTVTVTGDTSANTASATASATVTLYGPMLAVTETASPSSLPAPGGTFTFTVALSNPSTVDPVKITSLVDNVYGDLATRAGSTCGPLIGTTLAPGASPTCSFTGPFAGAVGASQTDTVTVAGVDANANTATATGQATVTLFGAMLGVTEVASPSSLPPPGGTFTFTVRVANPSLVDAVKITSLVDNVYGNLATRAGSTCGSLIATSLAPGATSAACSFTGPFTGVVGATQTDTVTVTGVDGNGNAASATGQATVTLFGPQIGVTETASPSSLPAPGGTFTFTVAVSNPSTVDPVRITKLVDNVYGNLATRAGSTCGSLIATTLAAGATSAACSFTGSVAGAAGAKRTDKVTVTGVDANGNTATATAHATVRLTAVRAVVPTIGQVCGDLESQVDAQLPGQTIASDLQRGFIFSLRSKASIGLRLVLRAKDPSGGVVSLANFLVHAAGPVTLRAPRNGLGAGYARRAARFLHASERAGTTLVIFKIVHCRPAGKTVSAESVGILRLRP